MFQFELKHILDELLSSCPSLSFSVNPVKVLEHFSLSLVIPYSSVTTRPCFYYALSSLCGYFTSHSIICSFTKDSIIIR